MSASPSPSSSLPLVHLREVSLTLGGVRAVDRVSLTLYPGQRLALLGPNGAGKSTLLRLIRGDAWPDQKDGGRIVWYPPGLPGQEAGDDSPLAGRSISSLLSPGLQAMYMRQDWRLRGEQIALAGLYDDFYLYREPGAAQRARVRATAALLGAERLLDMTLPEFSQGQLRLVLLIRALIRKPALLLLDEAADGLDAPSRAALLAALEAMVSRPDAPAMLLSTHRALPSFITEYLSMDQGRLEGPRPLRRPPPPPPACASPTAPVENGERGVGLKLRQATVFINHTKVLRELDWEVAPGENWAVLGANGSGKSTLLRLLLGHENVAVGGGLERRLDGRPLDLLEDVHKYLRLVSDQLQALYSYDDSAADVVFSGFDGSVGVYRQPSPEETCELDRLLAETGMSAWRDRPFRSLSSGQARRVLLARALAGKPRLLLLDEPFSGLDRQSRRAMKDTVSRRAAEGLQIILVSHHEEDILPCISRRAVLENGRLRKNP